MSATVPVVEGRLRFVCSDIDARPLFWNDGPVRLGYEPEAAHAVGAALGLEVEWVYTPWDDRWQAVAAGEADAVWCGVAVTPERGEYMGFSKPYAYFNEALVQRAGDTMRAPADTAGRRIGCPANSTNERLAHSWPGAIVMPFEGYDDVFTALIEATASGELDGFVDDEPAMVPLAERDDRLDLAFSVETRLPWAAAVLPGNTALIELLDQGIGRAIERGDFAARWQEHLGFLRSPFEMSGR